MIIIIVPAYNEEANVKVLLEKTRAKMAEIREDYCMVVVDDGSRDGTRAILEEYQSRMPIEIVSHPTNKGVGQVFRTGFLRALELAGDEDVIVTKEADNTSDLNILPEMIQKIRSGYDLVLASCYAPGGRVEGTSWFRHFLSATANLFIRLFFGFKGLYTFSSFYRVYRPQLLREAFDIYQERFITEKGFACMVEVLIKVNKLTPRITEVPMILRSAMRNGKSKMKISRTIAGYARLAVMYLFKKNEHH